MQSFNLHDFLEAISVLPNKTTLETKLNDANMQGILVSETKFDILLDSNALSIDDFINFAQQYNNTLYYNIKSFDKVDFIITNSDLENPTIEEYISVLSDDNENLFSLKVSELYDIDTEITDNFTVESFIQSESDDEDDEDEEDFDENVEKDLNSKATCILEDIKNFNNNIPDNTNQYTKSLILMCIINNQKIGVVYNNDYQLNTEVCLAELLHSYIYDYKISLQQYKEDKQQAKEKQLQNRKLAEQQLEETLLSDTEFALCTNQKMRKDFARDLYKNDKYDTILRNLFGDDYICQSENTTILGLSRTIPEHIDYRFLRELESKIEIIFRSHKDKLKLLLQEKK